MLDLSAAENMSIFAELYGITAARRREEIERLLEEVDLTKYRSRCFPAACGEGRKLPEDWRTRRKSEMAKHCHLLSSLGGQSYVFD